MPITGRPPQRTGGIDCVELPLAGTPSGTGFQRMFRVTAHSSGTPRFVATSVSEWMEQDDHSLTLVATKTRSRCKLHLTTAQEMLDFSKARVGELPIPRKMPPTIMLPPVLV